MDLFALPSREDAFPLAMLEASAAQLPVVTFASGGAPELVDDEVGRVVPYPDLDGFAAALEELRRRPFGASPPGRPGRGAVAERHDVAVGAPRTWAPAEALLAGSP